MKQFITRDMLPKIKAPKFKVAGFILNEYELRCLMLETAKNNIQSGISVIDMQSNQKAFIQKDGSLTAYIGESLKINGKLGLELLQHRVSKLNELAQMLDISPIELLKTVNKLSTVVKLEGLEMINKSVMETVGIKNKKNKI